METHFLLTSAAFAPTSGQLDIAHDDFINPGMYALELADFLENELQKRGYTVKFRCQEDWGTGWNSNTREISLLPFVARTLVIASAAKLSTGFF